jgi:superoxide dismutase
MFRGYTRILLLRADIASAELRRLLPLLPLKNHDSAFSTQSVASLIVATAFANTMSNLPVAHSRDCPVLAKTLPLSRVSVEPSFATRPCESCVRERVHYLASVMFCDDFEQRCFAASTHRDGTNCDAANKATTTPKPLEKEVKACFGSLAAFKKNFYQLSSSAMSPGRLWFVYSPSLENKPGGSLNLLCLPGCKVPLAHGLWPLAVVNLSEERLCDELERLTKSARSIDAKHQEGQPPAWSHAARSPSANAGMPHHIGGRLCGGEVVDLNLSNLQRNVVEKALDAVNWLFVEEQLVSALTYYNSGERASTKQSYRKGKEQLAALRAMSRMRDSGAVIHAADSVTISSSQVAEATVELEKDNVSLSSPAQNTTRKTTDAPTTTAGVQENVANTGSAQTFSSSPAASAMTAESANAETSSTEAAAGSSGPRPVQQPDGTWEYHYDNGDVTKVRKDGTKVFQTKDLTTTVYSNGDTLFEYPNNTSILDRADGMRITTYADGTTREDRLT